MNLICHVRTVLKLRLIARGMFLNLEGMQVYPNEISKDTN